MVTFDVTCPDCDHTEIAEVDLHVNGTRRHQQEACIRVDVHPEVTNLDDLKARFAQHYREAH